MIVVGFIATPGQLNIQPRIDGAQQAFKDAGGAVKFTAVATNADVSTGRAVPRSPTSRMLSARPGSGWTVATSNPWSSTSSLATTWPRR